MDLTNISKDGGPDLKTKILQVVVSGKSKAYLGKEYSANEIESMDEIGLTKLNGIYEAKIGAEMVRGLGIPMITAFTKAAKFILPKIGIGNFSLAIDDESKLHLELETNPAVNSSIGRLLSGVYLNYGDFIGPLTAILITASHVQVVESTVVVEPTIKNEENIIVN